ncbi:uncharacterized protein LOC129005144 [Macrosteles quadrilineatus]|uniref:uncharacterized protein LOC129005144 n=1 Tax=Macrosteles quadrilineatus TaxID=74068 RepID=UPI0023E2F705|nr:uncharacterized protein LOC129005144 [Macrosteles quadrilineatus]
MEKVINRHIRDTYLDINPLSASKHAFMKSKSTTTALSTLEAKIEETLEHQEFLAGVFMNIQGAFDNVSYNSIDAAVRSRGISPDLAAWINALLKSREVTAELGGYSTAIIA